MSQLSDAMGAALSDAEKSAEAEADKDQNEDDAGYNGPGIAQAMEDDAGLSLGQAISAQMDSNLNISGNHNSDGSAGIMGFKTQPSTNGYTHEGGYTNTEDSSFENYVNEDSNLSNAWNMINDVQQGNDTSKYGNHGSMTPAEQVAYWQKRAGGGNITKSQFGRAHAVEDRQLIGGKYSGGTKVRQGSTAYDNYFGGHELTRYERWLQGLKESSTPSGGHVGGTSPPMERAPHGYGVITSPGVTSSQVVGGYQNMQNFQPISSDGQGGTQSLNPHVNTANWQYQLNPQVVRSPGQYRVPGLLERQQNYNGILGG